MQVNSEQIPAEDLTTPTPAAGSAPARGPSAVVELSALATLEKAAALLRMKLLALALLIAMAVIFMLAFALQKQYPWLEYVRAAAEGGMVGALADWFAVTALFKYPMGTQDPAHRHHSAS